MMEPNAPYVIIPEEQALARNDDAIVIGLHEKMLKSIRSWGTWLLILGVVQLVASSFLEPTYGVLLLVVGALSFIFSHPALFVVYATTLAWAAVSNVLGAMTAGQMGWGGFGIVQVFLAYSTLREYALYRRNEPLYQEMLKVEGITEAKKRVPVEGFPIAGCALSILAALLMGTFVAVAIALAAAEIATAPKWVEWLLGLAQGVAVLALGLSAASLASRFRYKVVSILALAGAGLTVLLFIVLSLG